MSTLTLKFHGIQEMIINTIVEKGIAETKSEAVRMAVLKFGFDLGIMSSENVLHGLQRVLSKDELTEEDIMALDEKVKEGIHRHYMEKRKHASDH